MVGILVWILLHAVNCATMLLNYTLLNYTKERGSRVLKCFRWKIVAALLLFQPRAYGLVNELFKHIENEEAVNIWSN